MSVWRPARRGHSRAQPVTTSAFCRVLQFSVFSVVVPVLGHSHHRLCSGDLTDDCWTPDHGSDRMLEVTGPQRATARVCSLRDGAQGGWGPDV